MLSSPLLQPQKPQISLLLLLSSSSRNTTSIRHFHRCRLCRLLPPLLECRFCLHLARLVVLRCVTRLILTEVSTSSAKFSLVDVKDKMVKKEKSEETAIPNPVHIVATRSKGSVKKRKTTDPVTDLDSFEGLSAVEVKEKMHSLYSMLHLGYERMLELLKDQETELRESKEAQANLKGLFAAERKKLEEAHAKEVEELLTKVEEEKKVVIKEAKDSAVTSVYEAMYEIAKEASEAGFSLPQWDVQGWGEVLGKVADVKQADPQEPQAAVSADGADGGVKTTGDDSKDA